MTLSASPALAQVETALKASPGSFTKNNYRSVFDVARTSRKQFIADNMSWLGLRGGKAWDLAVGQAQYIRRLFREKQLTRQIRQSLAHTLSGQQVVNSSSSDNIQGLVQDGPTWQNQFAENWQAYCQSGAPEAVDSPVSYLTWLYKQALSFEEQIQASSTAEQVITLAERRPDLATLTVDNDAINQQIPALQLVNEILENNIATSLPADRSVDETLAETRYPTLLPYHFPHDQAELALLNAGVPLEEIIGETATDWPWFLNNSWRGGRSDNSTELASGLAPEQQTLVTEPDNSTASDLTAFYKTNLGLDSVDYTPFEDIDTFTYQLGITTPQVEELIAGNIGGSSVVFSPNVNTIDNGELDVIGAEFASGRYDSALSLYNRHDSYAYFPADSGPAMAMKGDNSFSVTMWIKVSAKPTDNQMPVICNCLMDHGNQGIRVCVNSGAFLLGITDSAGNTADNANKKSDGNNSSVSYNKWYLICLVWDITANKATVYYQGVGDSAVSTIEVDTSSLTGDITTAAGFTWVLNDSGDLNYYNKHPTPSTLVNCLYDDIGVFTGALKEDDFNTIFSSTTPLSENDSGLSAPLKYNYSLDEVDGRLYGAEYINKGLGERGISFYDAEAYNANHIPMDTGSNPVPLTLSDNGLTVVEGVFDTALRCDASQSAEMYIADDISTDGTDLKSFTINFWCRIPRNIPDQAVIITNKIDHYALSSKGITLFARHNDEAYQLELTASDGSGAYVTASFGFTPETWVFISLKHGSASDKNIYIRASTNNSTINAKTHIDVSTISSIVLETDCWGFNGNKGNNYYNSYPERRSTIDYDDITCWERDLLDEEIDKFVTSNEPAAGCTDMYHYYALDGTLDNRLSGLSDARMDRINRMVRLQRWLGLSYEETDLLLSACIRAQGANNADFTLNAHTLRALGVFRHWQQKYGVTAFQFAAVLDQITPYAISPAVPFLDQVFNSPSLFDEPFTITGETVNYTAVTGESARTVRQICAGLGITQAQFRVLADRVAAEQGDAEAKTFPLTLPVVSALYRLVMVPRWLGLSFADGAALLSLAGEGDAAWIRLAGVPQLAALTDGQPEGGDILDLLMALDAAAGWATEHKLSWVKSYLALQPEADALVATAATVNFVNGIKEQLPATLLSEQSFSSVPLPASSDADSWLAVFPDLVDKNGLVQAAAADYSTIAARVETDITSAGITFASAADKEQAISSLSGIINQARLTQSGIADSALAQMFSIAQSLPPFLLSWARDSEYRLLSDSLAMNSGAALTDPSQVPATYLTDLFALGQRAGISTTFTLTPAALSAFLAHPVWFGVSDTMLTLTLLYRFSRYGDWLAVAGDEDRVLAYLSWVNATTPPDAGQAADALALLLDWESSEVADATAALPDGLAKTTADVDYVMRLQQLSAETGLSVTPLLATGELAPGGVTDTWDAWQSAGESLVAAQQ